MATMSTKSQQQEVYQDSAPLSVDNIPSLSLSTPAMSSFDIDAVRAEVSADSNISVDSAKPTTDVAQQASKLTERELDLIVVNIHDAVDHHTLGFIPAGTDEEKLINLLKSYPPEQMNEIKAAYQRKYRESLKSRLESDLSYGYQDIALSYLEGGKAAGAAARLYHAMDTWVVGTDEAVIEDVLQELAKEPKTLLDVERYFEDKYKRPLRAMMDDEMDLSDYNKAIALLDTGRDLRAEEEGTAPYLNTQQNQSPADNLPNAPTTAPNTNQSSSVNQSNIDLRLKLNSIEDQELRSIVERYEEARKTMDVAAIHQLKTDILNSPKKKEWLELALTWKPRIDRQREFHVDLLSLLNDPASFEVSNVSVEQNGMQIADYNKALSDMKNLAIAA